MNYVVFDTETTSLNKPFTYNIGYIILNEGGSVLVKKDFVVEQIWHNLPLFSTAYYSEKRPNVNPKNVKNRPALQKLQAGRRNSYQRISLSSKISPHSGQNFGGFAGSAGVQPHLSHLYCRAPDGFLAPHSVQNLP